MSDVIEYDEKEQERERKVHAVEASSFDIPPIRERRRSKILMGTFLLLIYEPEVSQVKSKYLFHADIERYTILAHMIRFSRAVTNPR